MNIGCEDEEYAQSPHKRDRQNAERRFADWNAEGRIGAGNAKSNRLAFPVYSTLRKHERNARKEKNFVAFNKGGTASVRFVLWRSGRFSMQKIEQIATRIAKDRERTVCAPKWKRPMIMRA